MDDRAIGVFDSGIGGLTVVKELIRELPNEGIVYFGDTARVPYGTKSKETIIQYSLEVANFLKAKDVKAIVIACNTISSNAYEVLRAEFDLPIIEVVSDGVRAITAATRNKRIGIIGTEGTVRSGAYQRLIKAADPEITIFAKACPLFVPMVEEGLFDGEIPERVVNHYIKELVGNGIDSLLLACTHYPLLEQVISRYVGSVKVVNPAVLCAQRLKQYLSEHNMETGRTEPSDNSFYVSDNTDKFGQMCRQVLGKDFLTGLVRL